MMKSCAGTYDVGFVQARMSLAVAFLAVLAGAALPNEAAAQESGYFWPDAMIPTNGVLLYIPIPPGMTLSKSDRFVLVSDTDTVDVTVDSDPRWQGWYNDWARSPYGDPPDRPTRSAVPAARVSVLKPTRVLQANTVYHLTAYPLDGHPIFHTVTTGSGVDTVPPVWSGTPTPVGACDQPDRNYSYVGADLRDSSPYLVIVSLPATEDSIARADNRRPMIEFVRPLDTLITVLDGTILTSHDARLQLDPTAEGYVVSAEDRIIIPIGNGNLGGSVAWRAGDTVDVTLRAIDAAGNVSASLVCGQIAVRVIESAESAPAAAERASPGDDLPPSGTGSQPESIRKLLPTFEPSTEPCDAGSE